VWHDKLSILNIGDLELSSPLILSPMAGISDLQFRMLNRQFGCELAFAEMISARALTYRNSNTMKMLLQHPADRPLGIQLLGNDPEVMIRALDILRDYNFDVLDFNAACPVSKVTTRGEGSALMKEPVKIFEILKTLVRNCEKPVTVKIRAGWDESSLNARDTALYAQDAGVRAVFIHGRTRAQGYSGTVDYGEIRKVKEALTIPVIASGDAFSGELIKKLFDETGCDGVAIARGAFGNPWIFRQAEHYLKYGTLPARPSISELVDAIITHLNLSVEADGDEMGTVKFRKFFAWYVRGLHDTRNIRNEAFRATSRQEMTAFIDQLHSKQYRPGFAEFKR
jgi:tRNA-dihydrouridine synthase B